MPRPITVPMTSDIELAGNYVIRLTALSPTDGSVVSGVNISQGSIGGVDLSDAGAVAPAPSPVKGAYTSG